MRTGWPVVEEVVGRRYGSHDEGEMWCAGRKTASQEGVEFVVSFKLMHRFGVIPVRQERRVRCLFVPARAEKFRSVCERGGRSPAR